MSQSLRLPCVILAAVLLTCLSACTCPCERTARPTERLWPKPGSWTPQVAGGCYTCGQTPAAAMPQPAPVYVAPAEPVVYAPPAPAPAPAPAKPQPTWYLPPMSRQSPCPPAS